MNITHAFAENARNRPGHPAVEHGSRIVTYGELESMANGMAVKLCDLGVGPGDIVAVLLPDSIEHVALFLALARIGAVIFPINVQVLRDSHVAGLGGHPMKFAVARDASAAVPAGTKAISARSLFAASDEASARDLPLAAGDDMPLACAQSSGTTGTPKTFQMSHRKISAIILNRHPLLQLKPDDRYIAMLRLGFFGGWRNSLSALSWGATIIVNQARSTEGLVRYIRDKRVTTTAMTPSHVRTLLKFANGRPAIFPDMRALRVATGAISKTERAQARRHLTPNVVLAYGCNELNFISLASPDDQDARPDSVGRPTPGVEAEIVDEEGRPLTNGDVGLIRVRAARSATEYLNNPEATARTFRDGWVYPMDLAAIDDDGYIFLKGRADDRISVDGIKFYPIEVENVLRDHPGVEDVAVFGWPHRHHGEVPVAAYTADTPVKRRSLEAYCRKNLASYKVPRVFVPVEDLPRNPMGKIVRADLKEILADDLNKAFA